MKQCKLTGLVAATHTPFTNEGSLNLPAVERQAAHLLENGLSLAFIGGTTGECHSLSLEERRQLAQRWSEVSRGTSLEIVVHVGSNCLADARVLAAQAQHLGATAISALAPSYFKPRTLDDLVAWCSEVAAAAPETPFYFYDIPALTGVEFSMPDLLAAARDRLVTLAGIKFTNLDLIAYQQCLHTAGGFDLPWGVDEALLPALSVGATGAVGSTYNFAAPIYRRLIKAFAAGDVESARAEQFRSVQVVQTLKKHGYLGSAKAVMGMLGVEVGPARLPNRTLSPAEVDDLRAQLEALGFFEWIGP